jgi:branched-subunit amino acid transport protein AzlD
MSSFSNYGPPQMMEELNQILALKVLMFTLVTFNGSNIQETLSGTSIAITGLIVLLQQHYKNVNNVFMKAATVRGLLCHSADEAGLQRANYDSLGLS